MDILKHFFNKKVLLLVVFSLICSAYFYVSSHDIQDISQQVALLSDQTEKISKKVESLIAVEDKVIPETTYSNEDQGIPLKNKTDRSSLSDITIPTATQSTNYILQVDETGAVQLQESELISNTDEAQNGNPLYFDTNIWKAAKDIYFSDSQIGIGKDPGIPFDVDGRAAIQGKLTVYNDWEDNLIELFPSGNTGHLSSNGGALYINNTDNIGSGIGIYSDQGADALGNMINVKVDNENFAQAAFYMNYDGTSNAVEIVANTDDTTSNALSITNNNKLDSALGVIGYETGKGTVKISHRKSGNDQNASGLSIDLQGEGTAAQGIYVDSTATGGTTGKLLRLRNETLDRFVVDSKGSLTVGRNGTNTSITKLGNTSGDEFFVGTNGAFRVQRSVTDSEAFRTQVSGDTQGRWLGTADGKIKWGDGSSAQDVVLERSGASRLLLNGASYEIKSPATNTDVLTLTASDNSRLGRFVETGGGHGWFEIDNNVGTAQVLFRADGGDHYFRTGQVGIGTASPDYQLDIQGNISANYIANIVNDGDNQDRHGLRIQAGADDGSGTTYYLDAFDGDGDQVGYIANSSGTFGLTDISDIRTKTNVTNTTKDGLDIIESLRVVDFNRKAHPDGPIITGFIAQEVNEVFPEMVTKNEEGLLGIQKESLVPILTKAVQEQSSEIDELTLFTTPLQSAIEIKNELFNIAHQLVIKTQTIFEKLALFEQGIRVEEHLSVDVNIADTVILSPGQISTTITFKKPLPKHPIISLTPQSPIEGTYYVDNSTANSFDIVLNKPQDTPVVFGWLAIISQ